MPAKATRSKIVLTMPRNCDEMIADIYNLQPLFATFGEALENPGQ
jgi:hypothetical protein